jgi:hypothetical protein
MEGDGKIIPVVFICSSLYHAIALYSFRLQ